MAGSFLLACWFYFLNDFVDTFSYYLPICKRVGELFTIGCIADLYFYTPGFIVSGLYEKYALLSSNY